METSNSGVEVCDDRREKNDACEKENRKNGLRWANNMSQSVGLFRKYLVPRTPQQSNMGKTNMEESEVINKSQRRLLLPTKFSPRDLSRPPSRLEQKMFPALRCDSEQSTMSCANKASKSQLTIFYAGGVNVFDNVSAEKAKEVMLILGDESSSLNPVSKEVPRPEFGATSPCKPDLNSVADKPKTDVPLARKYSLQCFMEKRRDRIRDKSPYAVPCVPSEAKTDTDSFSLAFSL